MSGSRGQPLRTPAIASTAFASLSASGRNSSGPTGEARCAGTSPSAIRRASGSAYAPFESRVAEEEIDPYVLYRRLRPLYSSYKHLGIYQRHLETFEEKPVLRNDTIEHGCVNCHTFLQGAPDRFAISFRGRFGTPTLLIDSNRISRIDTKMGYLSWHPNGKLLAFAANAITQFFHLAGPVNRDIYDPHSDLRIFHVDDRTVEQPAAIAAPDRNENWPVLGARRPPPLLLQRPRGGLPRRAATSATTSSASPTTRTRTGGANRKRSSPARNTA